MFSSIWRDCMAIAARINKNVALSGTVWRSKPGERIGWYASLANGLAGQLSCEKSRESHMGKEMLRPAMIGELARPCSHATGQPFPFLNDTTQPKRTYQFSYYLSLIYILFGFSRRQRTNDYGFIERRVRLFSVFTQSCSFGLVWLKVYHYTYTDRIQQYFCLSQCFCTSFICLCGFLNTA